MSLKIGFMKSRFIDAMPKKFLEYLARTKRTKVFLKNASTTSYMELKSGLKNFHKNPTTKNAITLGKILTNSSTWVSSSSIRYGQSLLNIGAPFKSPQDNKRKLKIIRKVSRGEEVKACDQEIFKSIYRERLYHHLNPIAPSMLKFPETKITVVLVDGILNEIFSTSMFERGLENLNRLHGLKYFIPKVKGTKGSKYNSRFLTIQLKRYIKKNPGVKLWIMAYSKGGVDSLHFLKNNKDLANENILGISTIATPILGSNKFNNNILKFINFMADRPQFDKYDNFLFKDFQKFLNPRHQTPWFWRNHRKLPKNLFYTSLALRADWHESHAWMILTKMFFRSKNINDGIVDVTKAHFPKYYPAINLGTVRGHHMIGTRSSYFSQEALIESLLIFLNYKKLI
ncbi:MAG: hypothetical protein DRQ89_04465 [Epsilonproteobacteria bacterium]|nr:MAG: hypothetical protein DRQ89_04465 [Campylobacterota bacterium]